MKISIEIDPGINDTEVIVRGSSLTPQIEKMIATLRMLDQQMTVTKDDETFIIDTSKIVYAEAVDRRTFVYTRDECFESKLRLYEMEQQLCQSGFFRVSKSCLVQLRYIRSLRAELDRRLRLTLENGEQLIASRQYADELKKRLGVK